jgi:hypothetical protein
MAISNMPKEISGEFQRWYVIRQLYFIQGGYKEKTYKIQWHFKARDDLILGNGEIQITLGASFC